MCDYVTLSDFFLYYMLTFDPFSVQKNICKCSFEIGSALSLPSKRDLHWFSLTIQMNAGQWKHGAAPECE